MKKIKNVFTKLLEAAGYKNYDTAYLTIKNTKGTTRKSISIYLNMVVMFNNYSKVYTQKLFCEEVFDDNKLKKQFNTQNYLVDLNLLKFVINNIDEILNKCNDEIIIKYSKSLSKELDYYDSYYFRQAYTILINEFQEITEEKITRKMIKLINDNN